MSSNVISHIKSFSIESSSLQRKMDGLQSGSMGTRLKYGVKM